MFGMLDYRAHKLFWLLGLPFRVFSRLVFWALVVIAIFVVQSTSFSPLVKIVIAYVLMEAMGLVAYFLLSIGGWVLSKCFFWLIDVMPSKGADAEEAREVVKKGRFIWLSKKLATDIENWTYEDTDQFVSALNWRARWFFHAREKITERVRILQDFYYDTGKQPADLSKDEIAKLVGTLDGNWFERTVQTAIVSPMFFNSILAFVAIAFAISYLHNP